MSSYTQAYVEHDDPPGVAVAWPHHIQLGDNLTVTIAGDTQQLATWFRNAAHRFEAAADEIERQRRQAQADLAASRADVARLRAKKAGEAK